MEATFKKGAAIALALAALAGQPAAAAISVQKKIGEFANPFESTPECVKWAVYGQFRSFSVWMVEHRDCVGQANKNLHHSFFLIADGPDLDQAGRQTLEEALGVGISAAAETGLLTPSPEPEARIAEALVAGKQAFVDYLAARGLEQLASRYEIRIDRRTNW